MADLLKAQGNKAFAAKDWDSAIDLFGQAIALDPKNHVLYSNRSAAYAGKKFWDEALKDAEQCIAINPAWGKGYSRKGAALHGAKRWDDAVSAYNDGIKVEDSPALQKGLKEVQDARDADVGGGGDGGIGKMFQDPQLFQKLAANPKTAPLLSDPSFMAKIRMIQTNPAMAQTAFNDPRMISVLGVLMGIDMQGYAGDEASGDVPPEFGRGSSAPRPSTPPSAPKPKSTPAPPPPAPEPETEETKAKSEALKEKTKGNDAYKKREFDDAIAAFEKAWELWPKDLTFLTNLAAAQYEKGDLDGAIATSEKAVEAGRELRADYKLVAKAFGRIGTAYLKKENLDEAIRYFQKSLSENRTPDILNKLNATEKLKKEREVQAYIDPELAEKAREEGNVAFKAQKYPDAVKAYTEAIKRNPSDPRGYNNRALAYSKLLALNDALKDAEKAIEVDPKFVKAYIRKAAVLYTLKEYTRALTAIQQAEDADEEKKHTKEIQEQMMKITKATYTEQANESQEETLQRAMRDPEVAEIMSDPIMNQILQQSQEDPRALQDHMKNPIIRAKIQKLVAAGIIRTR